MNRTPSTTAANRIDVALEHGTAIVALCNDEGVFVAADSKSVRRDNGTSSQICKIHREGEIFFAIAGNVREHVTGWDAVALTRTACQSTGSPSERIAAFEGLALNGLQALMTEMFPHNRREFEDHIIDKIVLHIVFFGLVGSSHYLHVSAFKARRTSGGVEVFLYESKSYSGNQLTIAFLGDCVGLDQLNQADIPWSLPRYELVKHLVQVEIDANPGLVCGPIDVIELTAEGARWRHRKAMCSDCGIASTVNTPGV